MHGFVVDYLGVIAQWGYLDVIVLDLYYDCCDAAALYWCLMDIWSMDLYWYYVGLYWYFVDFYGIVVDFCMDNWMEVAVV